jgi:hypothetical protein
MIAGRPATGDEAAGLSPNRLGLTRKSPVPVPGAAPARARGGAESESVRAPALKVREDRPRMQAED